MNRIDEIRERCESATPEPWEAANKSVRVQGSVQEHSWGKIAPSGYGGGVCNCLGVNSYQGGKNHPVNVQARKNAEFIAHSREDVPYLLDEVFRKNEKIEKLTKERDWYKEMYDFAVNAGNDLQDELEACKQQERDGRLRITSNSIPEIVCLCGSTRFYKTFDEQNYKLTLAGKIVLSIGCNTKSDEGLNLTANDKERLDELHKRKIDLCDSVLVLNVDGYIGDSTKSEIEYAIKIGKPVKYLFPYEDSMVALSEEEFYNMTFDEVLIDELKSFDLKPLTINQDDDGYPCSGHECYDRGDYHITCAECPLYYPCKSPKECKNEL